MFIKSVDKMYAGMIAAAAAAGMIAAAAAPTAAAAAATCVAAATAPATLHLIRNRIGIGNNIVAAIGNRLQQPCCTLLQLLPLLLQCWQQHAVQHDANICGPKAMKTA